ncbi:hypothetical protein [Burkholderia sp. Cy-637]|uniref:hypothetical protein n=1 Tax=Burkholderia sp. Cy-637 TaxID=2608327 RepID=UPI0014246C78|nr:hypothetical protein [Burkholderia sp. Cy-637]NIF88343.1 hypothetical protein [Burkholderia sp. Cy-637]
MKKKLVLAGLMGSILSLSACGGGDDQAIDVNGSASNSHEAGTSTDTSPESTPPTSPTQQPSAQAACRPNGKYSYEGSASQVAATNGKLAVLVVPSLPSEVSKNRNMTAPNAPASSQVQQASGAFTTLASSSAETACLGMDHGAVTEIQGVGTDVAIGRWNQAMDTDGNTYTSSQGVHYAVGTPLALSATSGTLTCSQLIADSVALNNGGVVGTLGASSATLDLGTRTLDNLSLSINLANHQYTLTNAQAPLNGTSAPGALLVQSIVVGRDAAQPLIAIGYSATLPDKQEIGGVAVLSCR